MYKICPTCNDVIYIDEKNRLCPQCGQDLFGDWKTYDLNRNMCRRCDRKSPDCLKDCRYSKYITRVENQPAPIDLPAENTKDPRLAYSDSELSLLAKERLRKEYGLTDACFHTWIQPLLLTTDRSNSITTIIIETPHTDIHADYISQKYAEPLREIVSDILQEDVTLNCI